MDDSQDYLSGAPSALRTFLSGRKSLQRNPVSEISPDANRANVNGGLAFLNQNYDPSFKSLSVQRATDFGNAAGDLQAANGAPYGSIASRADPTQYGSIASREFSDQFGSQGSLNAGYQADSKSYADAIDAPNKARDNANAVKPIASQVVSMLQPQFSALFNSSISRRTATPSVDPADSVKDDEGDK